MTGLSIQLPSADFSAANIGLQLSVPQDCVFWNHFGGVAANTTRNQVYGMPGGLTAGGGTPAVQSTFALIDPASAYIDTQVAQTAGDVTIIATAQALGETGSAWLVTNNGSDRTDGGGGTTSGTSLFFDAAGASDDVGRIRFGATVSSGFEEATLNGYNLDHTAPRVVMGRFTASSGLREVKDLISGAGDTSTVAGAVQVGGTYWIGRRRTNDSGDPFRLSHLAIYNRALTDAEVALVLADIRTIETARGVTLPTS